MLTLAWAKQVGLAVQPVTFTAPFIKKKENKQKQSYEYCNKKFEVNLITKDLGSKVLNMLIKPEFGYGKNLNPCIDCRILMLREAKKVMSAYKADFIITGEILGQRPMSQYRESLKLIDQKSNLVRMVLRPLSAKLFPPTLPEEKGWIKRKDLLSCNGRTRRPQLELAKKWSLEGFESPAGGCLLTERNYACKLKDLKATKLLTLDNMFLIQYGRYFSLDKRCKVVVARNEEECEVLENYKLKNKVMLKPIGISGPLAVILGEGQEKHCKIAASLVAYYSKRKIKINILLTYGKKQLEFKASAISEKRLRDSLIP